jgi:hypothetical protein
MEKYSYARQKFYEAIYALVGSGLIKDRLAAAYSYLVILRPEQDIPKSLRNKFNALMKELEGRTIHYNYRPTQINTRAPKADKLARAILECYMDLRGGI